MKWGQRGLLFHIESYLAFFLKLWFPILISSEINVDAAFPILIAPSGEEMHFQRARTGEGMPFLLSGADSVELTRSYG